MSDLVIVESPAKAKLIQKFLGSDFKVKASMGHVRDLPEKKTDLSDAQRKLPYASLAVDTEHDYEPLYVVKESKKKVVAELKEAMKKSKTLWIAPDEDREGEAIGFHLAYLLKAPKGSIKRRRIKGRVYYYLQQRQGSKVLHRYLGREKPEALLSGIQERRMLRRELAKARAALRLLPRRKLRA